MGDVRDFLHVQAVDPTWSRPRLRGFPRASAASRVRLYGVEERQVSVEERRRSLTGCGNWSRAAFDLTTTAKGVWRCEVFWVCRLPEGPKEEINGSILELAGGVGGCRSPCLPWKEPTKFELHIDTCLANRNSSPRSLKIRGPWQWPDFGLGQAPKRRRQRSFSKVGRHAGRRWCPPSQFACFNAGPVPCILQRPNRA